MSELELIESVVRQAGRRRRLHRFWVGLWVGLFFGSLACLLILGLYKLQPLPAWVPWVGLGTGGLVWLVLALLPACRRVSGADTARWLDHKQQLHERLSTALELAAQPQRTEWETLVIEDAARRVKGFDPRRLLPLHFPRVGRWALLALVLAVGLGFVPEYRSQSFRDNEADQARIRETGRKLSDMVRQNMARRQPLLEPTQKAMESAADVGDALAKAPRTRDAALRDLASVQNKLSEQARQLAEQPGVRPLHQAAREPGGSAASRELQQKLAAMQKALGKAADEPGKLDALRRELENLKKEAAALAQKDPAAAAAARADLAQALAEAAEQARDMGAALPSLEAAIAALQASQDDVFLRDLNAAVTELEQLQEMARNMQNLAQQGAKTGKDLAEQLDKGQAQAAQATLQRMIEQLQSAHVSSEQMQKILDEVSRAIEPAGEYGQVAKELQKAAQQLKDGQTGPAAQSLANAAHELQDLMKQMQDLEALEGALAALAKAQNALAARKSWSEAKAGGQCAACKGMGCGVCNGPPRWGHGGGKGAGVGTWADDDSNYLPNEGPPPDNSGVQRPDMDARGISDRPTDLSQNLLPDRVKGELSPGESMPSIPLKGVSIRGQSTVQFEETAAAAQAEAQSALNQDRVPRAYQSVVKDYFDDFEDLKKR